MEFRKSEKQAFPAEQIDVLIDSPAITEAETIAACLSACDAQPASVWVKPCYLQAVATCLRNKTTPIGTVIGSPGGANATQIKVAEAKRALTEGATRLAVHVNLGFTREQRQDALIKDLRAVSGIAHMNGARVEARFDPGCLDEDQILLLTQGAIAADMDALSFPVAFLQGDWDFSLADLLLQESRSSLPLKGLIIRASKQELEMFFDRGFSSVGLKEFIPRN